MTTASRSKPRFTTGRVGHSSALLSLMRTKRARGAPMVARSNRSPPASGEVGKIPFSGDANTGRHPAHDPYGAAVAVHENVAQVVPSSLTLTSPGSAAGRSGFPL